MTTRDEPDTLPAGEADLPPAHRPWADEPTWLRRVLAAPRAAQALAGLDVTAARGCSPLPVPSGSPS